MTVREYGLQDGFREGKLFIDLDSKSDFFAGVVLSPEGRISHLISVNPDPGMAKELHDEDGIEPRCLHDRPDITCYLCPVELSSSCLIEPRKITLGEFLARWSQSVQPDDKPLPDRDRKFLHKILESPQPDISDEVDEIIKRNLRRVAAGEMTFKQLEESVPVETKNHVTDKTKQIFEKRCQSLQEQTQHEMLLALPKPLMAHLAAYEKRMRNTDLSISPKIPGM